MQTYQHRLDKWMKCQSKVRRCILSASNEQPSIHPSKEKHVDTAHIAHTPSPRTGSNHRVILLEGPTLPCMDNVHWLQFLATLLWHERADRLQCFFFYWCLSYICPWKLRSCMAVSAYLIMSLQESCDHVCMNGYRTKTSHENISSRMNTFQ